MSVASLDFHNGPFFIFPVNLFGYGLLGLYALLGLVTLIRYRRTFRLTARQWGLGFFLAVSSVGLAQLLIFYFPSNILPTPGLPSEAPNPGLSVFALIPAFVAGGWLGFGPAVVVGFITGLTRAAFETYSLITPFEYALVAGVVAGCLQQDYRGVPSRLVRFPFIAGVMAGGVLWPLLYLSYQAYTTAPGLIGWDYVASQVNAAAPVFFGQAAVAGLFTEFVRVGLPGWWPQRRGSAPPPYQASLNRKLLFTLIPLFTVGIGALFWADLTIAMRVSATLAIDQMARAAENAGQGIPFFIQNGRSLMETTARQKDLLSGGRLAQTERLALSMRTPFFRQMALYASDLQLLTLFPDTDDTLAALTDESQRLAEQVLAQGVAQDMLVYPRRAGESVQMLFMVPVFDAVTGQQVVAVLIGLAELDTNPLLQTVAGDLVGLAGGAGQGFVIDRAGRRIFPNPGEVPLPTFTPEETALHLGTSLAGATAYEDKAPDGTRRLVLYYPAPGHDWSVVMMVPNQWVLAIATQISQPIILILLLIGLIGLLLVSLIASQITRPAEALALAAQRISEGRLDLPVVVAGEDEVGRAGAAFERMRQKLRARLDELSLLLRVSQSVASNLNLDEALPPILEGAIAATQAAGAHLVVIAKDDVIAPQLHVYSGGEAAALMAPLDKGVMQMTRTDGRAVIENLARARAVLDVTPVAGKIHALVALPLRQESTYYGALWLAYTAPHTFTETEVNFLTTLAGQAAVAVANARLFEAAEQGRQRLAAILASTPDAVIVTDHDARVLLLNPAAEAVFGLTGKGGVGQAVANLIPNPELVKLLNGTTPGNTVELEASAGKTLYASASTIISADGSALGRVCVLRDVTHFKEVDMMKSEFVATVSHDLRAPLTFMRGYATMLPMVGALNDKQREFTEKIIIGIEQMTNLIDDLLDLGRIEAGVGLSKEPCRMDLLIASAVDALKPQAANKGLSLQVEAPSDMASLSGDATLLRQAISNLVENAIKYTLAGGQVMVRANTAAEKFTLAVTDTGVGISPADQSHLFEKFFRVKQRGSTQVKGSGLGLAIVKSIVERHGGRVWVESKLGKGSTFYFEIPANGLTN